MEIGIVVRILVLISNLPSVIDVFEHLYIVQSHVSGHLSFNFHKYIMRTLEDDFKHVVGVRY